MPIINGAQGSHFSNSFFLSGFWRKKTVDDTLSETIGYSARQMPVRITFPTVSITFSHIDSRAVKASFITLTSHSEFTALLTKFAEDTR